MKKTNSLLNGQIIVEAGSNKLLDELEFLKQRLNLGSELTLKWLPGGKKEICGEVKGTCICIYEEEEAKAVQALRHEFLDYLISKTIEPYQRIANLLIKAMNDEAYLRKEKLVETLCLLL